MTFQGSSRGTRWGICALIVSGLSLATARAQQYTTSDSTSRGTLTYNGTSYGAYTATPTYFDFQGRTTSGNFASTMAMPNLLANPVFDQHGQTVTISYANTEGLGDSGFNALIYVPDAEDKEQLAHGARTCGERSPLHARFLADGMG